MSIPTKSPLQLILRKRPRTESTEAFLSPGRPQPSRATSFIGQARFSAPGLFVGGVAAGDAPEDQGFSVVAGALIDRTPHGAEFAGAVETRNRLAKGAHDAGLFVAARTALRVDKRRPEFKCVVRPLFKRGRNERRIESVGLRGLLHGTAEKRVLPGADVFVPTLDGRFELFGRNLDGAGEIGDRIGLLDEAHLDFLFAVLRPGVVFAVDGPTGTEAASERPHAKGRVVEDEVARDARITMVHGVDLARDIYLAVTVREFIRKAAAVLVDPDVARTLERGGNVRRIARIADVQTGGVGVHVPELRAHGLRKTQTVAGVAGIAQSPDAGAHREVHRNSRGNLRL